MPDIYSALSKSEQLVTDLLSGKPWAEDRLKDLFDTIKRHRNSLQTDLEQLDPETRASIQSLILSNVVSVPPDEHEGPPVVWPSPRIKYPVRVRKQLRQALTQRSFNCFNLDSLTEGHALSALMYFIFEESGLFDVLNISRDKLENFALTIEQGYNNMPYHNSIHAACVLQAVYYILHEGGILESLTDVNHDLVCLVAYIAAAVHDFRHPGVTNNLLIQKGDPLAIQYHDQSVCENFHLTQVFLVLENPQLNILENLDKASYTFVRQLLISMVLKTDMQQHLSVLRDFREARTIGKVETYLILDVMMKVADLSHTTYEWSIHQMWVQLLEKEFFRQGDIEKSLGLPVSPLMDRDKKGLHTSQVGFLSVVVQPLLQSFVKTFPKCCPYFEGMQENLRCWKVFNDAEQKRIEQCRSSAETLEQKRTASVGDSPSLETQRQTELDDAIQEVKGNGRRSLEEARSRFGLTTSRRASDVYSGIFSEKASPVRKRSFENPPTKSNLQCSKIDEERACSA